MTYREAGSAGPSDAGQPSSRASGPPRRVDLPRPGYFAIRLIKKGPRVPARIRFEWGEFSAEVDGKPAGAPHADPVKADGVMGIWHYGVEIDLTEYERLVRRQNPPDPRKPIRLDTMPSIF